MFPSYLIPAYEFHDKLMLADLEKQHSPLHQRFLSSRSYPRLFSSTHLRELWAGSTRRHINWWGQKSASCLLTDRYGRHIQFQAGVEGQWWSRWMSLKQSNYLIPRARRWDRFQGRYQGAAWHHTSADGRRTCLLFTRLSVQSTFIARLGYPSTVKSLIIGRMTPPRARRAISWFLRWHSCVWGYTQSQSHRVKDEQYGGEVSLLRMVLYLSRSGLCLTRLTSRLNVNW